MLPLLIAVSLSPCSANEWVSKKPGDTVVRQAENNVSLRDLAIRQLSTFPEWCKKGYVVWTENSMKKIFPSSRPPVYATDPNINISLAKGEYESFQRPAFHDFDGGVRSA